MGINTKHTSEDGKQSKEASGEMTTRTEKVNNTPFIMRWDKEDGYSYGIGNYRISRWFDKEEEMLKELYKVGWNDINGLIAAMIDATLKIHNLIK